MSLKTWIGGVLKAISNFWTKLKPQAQKAVHVAILVVESIKNFDTTQPFVGDLITKLIPGEADDYIKDKLREQLPSILAKLKLLSSDFDLNVSPDVFVLQVIKELQASTGIEKSIALDALSKLVADVASDHKIDWDDLAYLTKWYYDNIYKTKAQP